MRIYPAWVMEHLTAGRCVKERNGRYYLYKRTSRRLPGRRTPVPQDEYLGVIDEKEGFVPCSKRCINVSDIRAYEYGYSKVLYDLCPDSWKRVAGSDWEDILVAAIIDVSSSSYLQLNLTSKISETSMSRVKTERVTLYRRMKETYDVSKDELLSLRSIHLLVFDEHTRFLTAIDERQAALLSKLSISLEVC